MNVPIESLGPAICGDFLDPTRAWLTHRAGEAHDGKARLVRPERSRIAGFSERLR